MPLSHGHSFIINLAKKSSLSKSHWRKDNWFFSSHIIPKQKCDAKKQIFTQTAKKKKKFIKIIIYFKIK